MDRPLSDTASSISESEAVNAIVVGPLVFALLVASVVFGVALSGWLPPSHLDRESKDAIRVATAVVGTLSALALGLLIASAKATYESARVELQTTAARIILLDRVMRQYGHETEEARTKLRAFVEARLRTVWNSDVSSSEANPEDTGVEPDQEALRARSPSTKGERLLQNRALQVSGEIAEAHWVLSEGVEGSIPIAFVAVLVLWLCLLFTTFGLLASPNWMVYAVLFACAVSVSAGVFLIVDMDRPYRGVVHVSDHSLRLAMAHLNEK